VNVDTFLEQFGYLADAPEGFKKLRELILDLAIRGKLVEQDPADEPARTLLQNIRNEKQALFKSGKIKKTKSLTPDNSTDDSFELPLGWEFTKLDDLIQKLGAGSTPRGGKSVYCDRGIKFLRSQNIWNDGLRIHDVAFIPDDIHEKMNGTVVRAGDILLNITGASIGRCALVPDDFDEANVSQHVSIVRLVIPSIRKFIHIYMISPSFFNEVMRVQVGISREGLSITRLREFQIPIPPLAEQKRIVAKVDELMALCDELETQQQQRQTVHAQLTTASLHQLTTAETPRQQTKAWQRIDTQFDQLFTTRESIKQLRQTILQLAVQGKLVPQDPGDEPAEEFFEEDEVPKQPYKIPESWKWLKFKSIAKIASCLVKPTDFLDFPHIAPNHIEKGTGRLLEYKTVREDAVKSSKHHFFPGQILYSKIRPNLAKTVIVDFEGLCSADMYPIESKIYSEFLLLYLLSGPFLNMVVKNDTRVAMPKVNKTELSQIPVPVPPDEEQKRIVSKVGQLMELCVDLEQKLEMEKDHCDSLSDALTANVFQSNL